jgi:hypothetical protein
MKINESFLRFSLTVPPEITIFAPPHPKEKNFPEAKSMREHEADDKNKERIMDLIVTLPNPAATR